MELLPSIIVGALVALIATLAIRSIIKKRKRGDCGCGCENCSGCSPMPTGTNRGLVRSNKSK